MPSIVLTDISLRNLKPPSEGQVIYTDKTFPGFGVRLTKGSKSYVLTYGKDRKRVTLGEVGKIALREARKKARDILEAPEVGQTFKTTLDAFLGSRRANNKASTALETERLLTRHFEPLYSQPLDTLKTSLILATIDRLPPSEANHAFVAVKTMLRWAKGQGLTDTYPLEGTPKPYKPVSRERCLSEPEITTLLQGAANGELGTYPDLLLALLYTGQRLGQLQAFTTEWIEGDTIRFPASVMKSGREHIIPIGNRTRQLLSTFKPYKDLDRGHKAFLKATGLPAFVRHDLRRTYATSLANLDVAPHIIERLLDHRSGVISGVSAIYNRAKMMQPMRAAVELYDTYLEKLASAA